MFRLFSILFLSYFVISFAQNDLDVNAYKNRNQNLIKKLKQYDTVVLDKKTSQDTTELDSYINKPQVDYFLVLSTAYVIDNELFENVLVAPLLEAKTAGYKKTVAMGEVKIDSKIYYVILDNIRSIPKFAIKDVTKNIDNKEYFKLNKKFAETVM
jgi:hypothetical protein